MAQLKNKNANSINEDLKTDAIKAEVKANSKTKQNDWKKLWWVILLTECFGAFILTLWIILPSTMAFSDPLAHPNNQWFWGGWANLWGCFFMKALWAGGFVTFVVYVFRPISVNFNPAVTLAEMGLKNDSVSLGSMKILVQMIGGLMAGFIAFGIASSMNLWNPIDNPANYHTNLDAVIPVWRTYNNEIALGDMQSGRGIFLCVSMFLEFFYTFALIASIFYFHRFVSHQWRPIFVGLTVTIVVALGLRTGNISINPARMFGPAIAHDTMARSTGLINEIQYSGWIWFYLLPQIAAGAIFSGIEMHKKKEI